MQVEVLPPRPEAEPRVKVRVAGVRTLGVLGTLLALMTMLAAFGFGMLILFGKTLLAAAIVKLLWPAIFSSEFTSWVFGSQSVPFFKVFLLLMAAGMVVRLFRPGGSSWLRK